MKLFIAGIILLLAGVNSCGPVRGSNAAYQNTLGEKPGLLLDIQISDIESRSGEKFMHQSPESAELKITIVWGELEDGTLAEAFSNDDTCTITVSPIVDPSTIFSEGDFMQILAHEIGHCFGLQHKDDPANQIMGTYFNSQIFQLNPFAMDQYIADLKAARGI